MLKEQAMTEHELIDYTIEVTDYAEEQGLDPIGASDMLQDLAHFAQTMFLRHGYVRPERLWNMFKESGYWDRYYPESG